MKVSIVTPSLNQAAFIERTIRSVLDQQWSPFEHIVIDGGSTDGTLSILQKYSDRVQWVSEPDHGQSDAVNKGIRRAAGEIIGWLNSDDIYYPGAISEVAQFFAAHPEIDAVYGEADYIGDDDSVIAPYPTQPWDFAQLQSLCFICQPALFYRRAVFERHGYLDTDLNYCMDYEYFLRLGRGGARFAHLSRKLAGSRMYVGNKTISGSLKAHTEINDMFHRRFGRVPDSWLFSYAHTVAKQRTDMRQHPFLFLGIKGVQTISAALRWNRSISPTMIRLLAGAVAKKIFLPWSRRAEAGAVTTGDKPSWWWN